MEEDEASANQAPTTEPHANIPGLTNSKDPQEAEKPKEEKGPPGLADADLTKDKEKDQSKEDPEDPEIEDDKELDDFETWRNDYMKLAIACDTNAMLDSIRPWRNVEDIEAAQAKFINDNYQILLYREDATIDKISKEIRSEIKKSIGIRKSTNLATSSSETVRCSRYQRRITSQIYRHNPWCCSDRWS